MKRLLNRETVLYVIFGGLTTLVNYVVFWLGIHAFGEDAALWVNVVAFIAAAAFAYFTNKLYVFESRSWRWEVLRRELPSFFGARIVSFLLEEGGLALCTDVFHVARYRFLGVNGLMIAKVALSVVVVVLNYLFSKLYIFSRKERTDDAEDAAHHSDSNSSVNP